MLHRRPSRSRSSLLVVLAAGVCALAAAPAGPSGTGGAAPADSTWTVNLLTQTDSRAEMHPCHCPGIGGSLALRSGVFKRLRSSHDAFLVLDGGDAVPTDSVFHYRELAGLVLDAMAAMHYDAAVPGETELALGPATVIAAARRIPYVCANLSLSQGDSLGIPAVRYLAAGDHTVAVTGYVDPLLYYGLPGMFEHGDPPFLVRDPLDALGPVVQEARKRADLVVLLAHAAPDQVALLLPQLPGVGAVVVGHAPGEHTRFDTIGAVPVVYPNLRSREVAQIRLAVDAAGTATDAFHRTWDLRQASPEDPAVVDLVKRFEDEYGTP